MKVRIKDWDEAVKAALIDIYDWWVMDNSIFGINSECGAWGEVVEGHKDGVYFCGGDNFVYPLCVVGQIVEDNTELVNPDNILRCGKVITDDAYASVVTEFGRRQAIRIRLIAYNDDLYYHKMVGGDLVECRKVGRADDTE